MIDSIGNSIHTQEYVVDDRQTLLSNDLTSNDVTSSDIAPIHKSYEKITDISQIPNLVEAPLVSAVEKLFKKKIETIDTSANNEKIWIQIYYDWLNLHNLEIVEKLIKQTWWWFSISWWSWGRPTVTFSLPPIKSTPVNYIQEWGNRIADSFESQHMIIIKKARTLSEMAKFRHKEWATEQEIVKDAEWFITMRMMTYDPLKKLFSRK